MPKDHAGTAKAKRPGMEPLRPGDGWCGMFEGKPCRKGARCAYTGVGRIADEKCPEFVKAGG